MMMPKTLLGLGLLLPLLVQANPPSTYVNPFIGTGGHGHTFPGATTPHGMVQASPDTRHEGWDACSGYFYADTLVNGFAQTHLSGTGCADYGDFLLMPFTGTLDNDASHDTNQNRSYASPFSHSREKARPGYYATHLDRYDINAEITATPRGAMYRFTFPEASEAGILLDMDYAIQGQENTIMSAEVVGESGLDAYKVSRYWAGWQPIAMALDVSRPVKITELRDTLKGQPRYRVLMQLPGGTRAGEEVLLRLALSHNDPQGARRNLQAELPGWNFQDVRSQATEQWDRWLGKIKVEGPQRPDDLRTFYTAMYHAAIAPNIYSDVDGRYRGMDREIYQSDGPVFTVFSLWDTHRALHPLLTIIDPALNQHFIASLLRKAREGGILPMWELAGNYTATMPGYHSVAVMADAASKGQADFDLPQALRAAERASRYDTLGIQAPRWLRHALSLPSKLYKDSLGYIPWQVENESVAKGLEYAFDDWCISVLARAAGDSVAAADFERKGQLYRNYFDTQTRFMRGRDAQGRWHEPFNPFGSEHRNDDYCEGTAWQWQWFVPHDPRGLIELMGGRERFVARLDSLFAVSECIEGAETSPDISGLIGQYAHGNEPSHHITHLYNYAWRPDRTQELVSRVMREQYRDDPDGLAGNEDCGQMSAWYIMNALGLYQVCAGNPVYSLGRPWFEDITVALPLGKELKIKALNFSPQNNYVAQVKFNGQTLTEPFIRHADLVEGGTLEFIMTDKPCSEP